MGEIESSREPSPLFYVYMFVFGIPYDAKVERFRAPDACPSIVQDW